MQNSVSQLTHLTQAIRINDAVIADDREGYDRLSAQVATMYFSPPQADFNAQGVFWVVFEGRQRGIYGDWGMANAAIMGVSGNSHKKIRGWDMAVEALTKHLWDQGFRPDESDLPPAQSTSVRHEFVTNLRTRAPHTSPSSSSNRRTPHVVTSPAFNARTPAATQPRISTSTNVRASPVTRPRTQRDPLTPSRISTSVPTQSAAPPAYTSVTTMAVPRSTSGPEDFMAPAFEWFIVASSLEIAVFRDRAAAECRASEHEDAQQLTRYCRTASMAAMLRLIEQLGAYLNLYGGTGWKKLKMVELSPVHITLVPLRNAELPAALGHGQIILGWFVGDVDQHVIRAESTNHMSACPTVSAAWRSG
ncbi:hypothetical protein C8R45DRAFT_927947 [Mycena sanguinolenta]|nr:hypothetical protein C8R45DRAFT_927947 [Mycena sanguinolenta]